MAKFEAAAVHKVNPIKLLRSQKKGLDAMLRVQELEPSVGRVSHTPVTGEHKWSTAWE